MNVLCSSKLQSLSLNIFLFIFSLINLWNSANYAYTFFIGEKTPPINL